MGRKRRRIIPNGIVKLILIALGRDYHRLNYHLFTKQIKNKIMEEKYIALQKIRTANENYVHFTVTGIIGDVSIAPMVFIPFIENAFKHANNKKMENAITVNIHIMNNTIQLVCENKFDTKMAVSPTYSGLGNELIEKRLHLIYAGKHSLNVTKTNERYCINLTIPHG